MRPFLVAFSIVGCTVLVLVFIAALWGARIVQWAREVLGGNK